MIIKSNKMVTIQSNNDGKKYRGTIHAELLCHYSTYYRAAMKGRFLESTQETFTLDLGYLNTRAFVAWLYSGSLADRFEDHHEREELYALYVFADKTDILALRRSIMSYLSILSHDGHRTAPNTKVEVSMQLPDRCGLNQFLLDEIICDWEENCCPSNIASVPTSDFIRRDYPEGYASRIIAGFADIMARKTSGESIENYANIWNACNYHEHENRQEWQLSK